MSWVTDVVVLCNLAECSTPEEFMGEALPPPFASLNEWLRKNEQGSLVRLDAYARAGGKAFQAIMAGGAFNHFPVQEFLALASKQQWVAPESVQILTKDEEAESFTVHLLKK